MVRRTKQPASSLRVYRHFAVVTMVLTGALALFADGESRQAFAEEIAEREQKDQLAQASAEKFGPPRLIKKPAAADAGFGPDPGGFGEPMDDAGGASASGYVPGDAEDADPAAFAFAGMSEAEWEALSEEQRAELTRRMEASAALAASSGRQQQIQRLKAASAGRSGARTGG